MALADSPHPHEAAAALRMAQRLMQEHNVTEADVAATDLVSTEKPLGRFVPTGYQGLLLHLVTKVFSCEMYITTSRHNGKLRRVVRFVSMGPNAEIAGYCYTVLYRKLTQARTIYYQMLHKNFKRQKRTHKADVFAEGWVMGCAKAAEALVPKNYSIHPVVAVHLEEQGLVSTKSRSAGTKKKDVHDLIKGIVAGEQVKLNQPVYSGEAEREARWLLGIG